MFTIDLTLKHTPLPLSVQRKTIEDAETLYQQVVGAMRSGSSEILELTCEKMPEKKIAVFINQLTAVQISEKSGAAAAGKAPGFAALVESLSQ
ncbi:hypothetical protein [Laspinema olomoucense]|uniref:UPF0367 protein NG792_00400 n=1 Tax=Laspinema olomoucense D3b TaxID=2953688 RepID=A0ABT2N0I4_9CYAN|nr:MULTISPECIES: hypothetical protein [unclassified Laspinema]MCT7974402.1 hypothetical protein [Laspinema sp. D3d]MCT7976180.1 hypothetical protein [Laspinema sp. D3b]MCT7990274.1 hypothetical protein [Laspinema sp. D3a]MCT7994441.1 hypothetical protein [Laspinema sp. D3c]